MPKTSYNLGRRE